MSAGKQSAQGFHPVSPGLSRPPKVDENANRPITHRPQLAKLPHGGFDRAPLTAAPG